MKKRIAILSLIAIFVAATSISAQTTAPKAEKAKTEKKACCKDPKSADCKKDAKAGDKKACCKDKKACDKKADTKK